MKFPLKRVSGFFFLCLILYGILMAPWLGLSKRYATIFCHGGNLLFARYSFGGGGSVFFEPMPTPDGDRDVYLRMVKRHGRRVRGTLDINSGLVGYRPLAFLVALVLATPITLKRRAWALLGGLILVNLFVALRMWLKLYAGFSSPGPLNVITLGEFSKTALQWAALMLYRAPEMNYIVPAFIWLLVSFRRGDLRGVLAPPASHDPPKPPGAKQPRSDSN